MHGQLQMTKMTECCSMYSCINGYGSTELDECLVVCAFCRVGAGVTVPDFTLSTHVNFQLSFSCLSFTTFSFFTYSFLYSSSHTLCFVSKSLRQSAAYSASDNRYRQGFAAQTKRLRIDTKGGQRRSITSTHHSFRHSLTHLFTSTSRSFFATLGISFTIEFQRS